MYRFERILVPTDFSQASASALEHATMFGSRFSAEVTLLHVDEFSVSPLGALGIRSEAVDQYLQTKRRFLEETLSRMAGSADGRGGITVKTRIESGSAYKVITEVSESEVFDLVVMPTRGLTGLSPHLIGSTTERVVRLCRQPVLSVPFPSPARREIASILCPTDLSPAANVVLSHALTIARQSKALLTIYYVSDLDRPEPEEEIRRRMPGLSDFHPAASEVSVDYVFDRDIEPSNAIIRFAKDREVDLIVMATQGRKGLRRIHIGTTAAEVVRLAECPVLTLSHPYHKVLFSRPLTQTPEIKLPEPRDRTF